MNKLHNYSIYIIIFISLIVFLFAINIGPTEVNLFSYFNNHDGLNILLYRLKRIILAFIVGSALASSGCIFQSLLKNPMADPFTIGTSSGAAFGATIAIVLNFSSIIPLTAVFGSLIAIIIIFFISYNFKFHPTATILAGIALNFILSSAVLLLFALSRPEKIHKAIMWLSGDLSLTNANYLILYSIIILIMIIALQFYSTKLDILSFGINFAKTHGITYYDISILFWIASICTAVTVAISGVIGFIGLIIPNTIRLIKANHKFLIPISSIAGGTFLVFADTIGRSLIQPYEIPCGIITGFFGGIFFLLFLVFKHDF